MDKSKVIFGNAMSRGTYKKAVRGKKGYVRKFGDDSNVDYELTIRENKHIGDILGVKDIVVARPKDNRSKDVNRAAGDTAVGNSADTAVQFDHENGIIVGNIRMGFGHFYGDCIGSAQHGIYTVLDGFEFISGYNLHEGYQCAE